MKNKHAQALSKLGASKGGFAGAAALSYERKVEIAKKAAAASAIVRRRNAENKAAGKP